jgi:DNA-binding NtrC family response regulator
MIPTTTEILSGATGQILRTILVVEDNQALRSAIANFLQDCGYIVIGSGDVAETKSLLVNQHVDLVFSDVNMPNREAGIALEKWIGVAYPSVKVLLSSGFPQASADTRELRVPVIPKPYSYSALLRRIDAAFAG